MFEENDEHVLAMTTRPIVLPSHLQAFFHAVAEISI